MNARAEIAPAVRGCAVSTRKSSEEGLDQAFNSLHAQRDACEAYVKSQASEGWTCLPAQYDDGGVSGGTMERPGLKQLLADIASGLIDVVVVYKVAAIDIVNFEGPDVVHVFPTDPGQAGKAQENALKRELSTH